MALIFLDHTKCAICGETLKKGDDIHGLPAMADTTHPLYPYGDRGFHKECFEGWDKKEEIHAIYKKQQEEYEQSDYYKEMEAKYGKPKS